MTKIINYLTTLTVALCLIRGSQCGGESSKKVPIVLDQPKDLCECSSESRFINQIRHNYEIMFSELSEIGCSCNERDLVAFKKILNDMKIEILNIIDAYYKCNESDPTQAIIAAIGRYDKVRSRFRSFGRNGYNNLCSKCNSAIQYVRQLRYISAENTITSMLTCATMKTSRQD